MRYANYCKDLYILVQDLYLKKRGENKISEIKSRREIDILFGRITERELNREKMEQENRDSILRQFKRVMKDYFRLTKKIVKMREDGKLTDADWLGFWNLDLAIQRRLKWIVNYGFLHK